MSRNVTTLRKEQNGEAVNGVDVGKLRETMGLIRTQPDLANFRFRATNEWVDGSYNHARLKDYFGAGDEIRRDKPFGFSIDEPPILLGADRGANPVEYALVALSGCLTTSLAYHAALNGIEIEGIESDYEGDVDLKGFLNIDPKVRPGYKEIRVRFRVKSDASEEKLTELAKRSPVYDTLTNPTSVKLEIQRV